MLSLGLSMRYKQGASALMESSPEIADQVVKMIARNPRLLEKLRQTGVIGDWFRLASILQPVAMAFWADVRSGGEEDRNGGDLSHFTPFNPTATAGASAVG